MPRPPTSSQAIDKHLADQRRKERADRRAKKGLSAPEPPPDGESEREYQARLEAQGQLSMFAASTEGTRHVRLDQHAVATAPRAPEALEPQSTEPPERQAAAS